MNAPAQFAAVALAASLLLPACRDRDSTSDPPRHEPAAGAAAVATPVSAPIAVRATPQQVPAAQQVQPAQPITPLSSGALIEDERNSIQIFREAAASVVFVTQKRVVMDRLRTRALEVPAGSGSGFIWDDRGHIVTNYHVVAGAQKLSVTLYDEQTYEAKVIGAEPRKDIAVLRLIRAPKEALKPISLQGSSEQVKLEVGQKAVAIGNPFGLDHTLTTGIISALGREVQGVGGVSIRDMIQTDAAINPGNSGGPLLNSSGELIGMNTMIFSKSGSSAGIGFAVPASSIRRVVPQLIEHGVAKQVGLGVRIDPQGRLERRANLRGVIVMGTIDGSPAEKAGLAGITETPRGVRIGDVIVGVAGKPVASYDDLYNVLDTQEQGARVEVLVENSGKRRKVSLELVQVQ